jgi:hypothetical protein
MRIKVLVLCVSIVLLSSPAVCQDFDNSNVPVPTPSHLVFVEAGGHGLASINYEHYLSRHVGLRIGYGIYVPLLVNYYFGDERMLEAGAGVMYSPYACFDPFIDKRQTVLVGATIGHKFQPKAGGVTLRYSFTPMFNPANSRFLPMLGLSVGLAFR